MLKGWITDKIKNGELFGWLLESESYDHPTAVVVVDGKEFETLCDRPRTKPVKFPLHKNFGFRISLPSDFIDSLQSGAEIVLKEKNTGEVVYRCSLRLNDESPASANEQSGISGGIYPYVRDNCISGFLACFDPNDQKVSEKRIAEVIIDGDRHICVASRKGSYNDRRNRNFKNAGFKIRLLPDRIAQLPSLFSVRLSDLKTGKVIEERKLKKPALFTPANFDEYLRYSMISPMVYAPFDESHRRCFAMMENVCAFLEGKAVDQELCSVIMPVYNRAGCVSEAIQSVLEQSHRNFELIIVDDGSTDDTAKVIRSFADPRIHVITSEQNNGCAHARNLGLEKAKGKYVFYLDSDNLWDSRYLKAMVGAFNECDTADALYCGQYLFGKDLKSCMAVRFASYNPSLLGNRNYIDLNCFAHRRDIIEKVGLFNSELRRLVDAEFILRISKCCRICSVPVLLSIYRYERADNTITETEKTPDANFALSVSQDSHAIPDYLKHIFSNDRVNNGEEHESRHVSIVIPSFEGIEVLKQCISSILNSSCRIDQIIIVDNCSSEESVSSLISYFDSMDQNSVTIRVVKEDESAGEAWHEATGKSGDSDAQKQNSAKTAITLLLNHYNFGFSHAVNQGLSLVNADNDVIISNNDALFHHEAVEAMAIFAVLHKDCGIIAPRQMLFAGQGAITSHVPFADPSRNCDVNLSAVYRNIERVPLFSDGRDIEIAYAPFFCVYITREVLNKLPVLDEEHGRHFRSDRIFCDYVRDMLGYKIYYAPDAIVYHHHQYSTNELKSNSPELYRTMYEQNVWDSETREKFGFAERIWQEEYSDSDREIWRIKNSGFFDESWYKERYIHDIEDSNQNIEIADKGGTASNSDACLGSDGVNQSPHTNISDADQKDFSRRAGAEAKNGEFGRNNGIMTPLGHYLTQGWKKGNRPSEYFDETLKKSVSIGAEGTSSSSLKNPLLTFLRKSSDVNGQKLGYSLLKNLSQDAATRLLGILEKPNLTSNFGEDLITLTESLASAKVTAKDLELVRKSKFFDQKWYQKRYPEVGSGILDPLQHYLLIGWTKGYDPSQAFCSSLYLEFNSDVKKSGVCPLLHYLKSGKKENRKIYPAFVETVPTITDRLYREFKGRDPLISIIVASYNYADIISEALDSILAQTYGNYEVIIVDDGSNDNSVAVIEKYLSHENFHLFTHENHVNRGLPETIKLGLAKSRGDYIAFLEADDLWERNYLEEKVLCIKKYADVRIITNDLTLFGDRNESDINGIRKHMLKVNTRFTSTRTNVSAEEFRKQNLIFTFSCTMVRKDSLAKCDFDHNPVKANLDWWLWRQICLDSPVYFINKRLTRWRLHDSYMNSARFSSRLNMEIFLSEGDRLLLSTKSSKARPLSNFTDVAFTFVNGYIIKDGKVLDEQPKFSIIMAVYNRADRVKEAIDSLFNQLYRHFELIIIDDGSTDGTADIIEEAYKREISAGIIRIVRTENCGVSHARNTALELAKNPWIAYLDSDNIASPVYLASFAEQIVKRSKVKAMYGMIYSLYGRKEIGSNFSIEKLRKENFIDLNAFCHSRELYLELGGFDTNMKRLVDWDLILRYSEKFKPHYINRTLVLYDDSESSGRITTSVDLYDSFNYERKKQNCYPMVTTVITTYNHEKFISEAIESAVVQRGEFVHEILVSDDGSTDRTRQIVKEYVQRYPNLIRDISSNTNLGISQNMKKCFSEAKGEYIAILEGDDYWTDNSKLETQLSFMKQNKDCSMVFNRIQLLKDGKLSPLTRQDKIPKKLIGDDFIREPTLNLIANFSCCFFISYFLKTLPPTLYGGRFNEIALAFYIEQKGRIGFIDKCMTVYRIHENGVWSAANEEYKRKSSIECREEAFKVCRGKYKKALAAAIEQKCKN